MKLHSLCIVLGLAFALLTCSVGMQAADDAASAAAQTREAEDDAAPTEAEPREAADAEEPPADDGFGGYPEALVVTRTGQWIRGGLKFQSDDEVILVIAGIDLKLEQREIRRIELLPSVRERYEARRAQLHDSDYERRLDLVEWLMQNHELEIALEEAGSVLDADPDSQRARRLFYTIGAQITMQRENRRAQPQEDGRLSLAELYRLLPDNRITEEEANLLRVYEIDLSNPPRMVIPRAVRERLVEKYTGDPLIPDTRTARAIFMQQSDATVLGVIFRLGAREFYDDVRVLEQPRSLELFRDDVHRKWLLSSCGTTRCHGGLEAGRFFLHTRDRGSDRTVYSNFLTLERFRLPEGEALINYSDPPASPLLDLGLPHDLAAFDHPEVEGWRPAFRDREDRKFLDAVEWIKSMYLPRPSHAIEYEPPSLLPPETFRAPEDEGDIER